MDDEQNLADARETLDVAMDAALRTFGHASFRPGQREAIRTLIEQRRLLLVAPTGGGKSLTYQLPATILPGTSLVISPLIALMHDQVAGLEAKGVSATFLASTLDGDEMRTRMAKLADGEYDLVYVAPERLFFPGFRELMRRVRPPLIAVDEAHCISEWGHDFRPEYARLAEVLRDMPDSRVLACTATATPFVRDEILARLGLGNDTPQLVRGFARPNLVLAAREHGGKQDLERSVDAALVQGLGSPSAAAGAAIVYAPTRKKTEAEADRLAAAGWRVDAYHAGLDPSHRERVSRAFIHGEVDVVVATNAFGMGIDRADVRAVVHLAPPGSVEAYYQEVGRAGRDGEKAYGTLLYGGQDLPLRRRLLEQGESGDAEILEHKWNLFLELMRWAEGGSCRHDALLRYFGDEAELLSGCGLCDVCTSLDEEDAEDPETVSLVVRKALSAVARIHQRYGATVAVKLMRGEQDERLERAGLDQVRTFGVLSEFPAPWLQRLVRRLVSAGWVNYSGDLHPTLVLTAQGRAVMQGERPARLLLPERGVRRVPKRNRERGSTGPEVELVGEDAQRLFEALRGRRLELAKEREVPPYVVASDRSLREIVMLRPRSPAELEMVHGIGPAKVERYGAAFLEVLREFGDTASID